MGAKISAYADWILNDDPFQKPAAITRGWVGRWEALFSAMASASHIHELLALITARWEFLGALYLGNPEEQQNAKHAMEYCRVFLVPIQPRYSSLHDITNRREKGSDIFTMFRHKCLHGITPCATAILPDSANEVIVWRLGFSDIALCDHLTIKNDALHVNADLYRDEFLRSALAYVDTLDSNQTGSSGRTAIDNWRRAWWGQFCPRYFDLKNWMKLGYERGVAQ